MRQACLAALYGHKRREIANFISDICGIVSRSPLGPKFASRDHAQIHATLVGFERLLGYQQLFNANSWIHLGIKREMDFSCIPSLIHQHLPMNIQFGGYDRNNLTILSHEDSLFNRSIVISKDMKRLVLIGWPINGKKPDISLPLGVLRESLEHNCNVRHAYGTDNDFYLVIGDFISIDIANDAELRQIHLLNEELRQFVSGHALMVNVTAEDVALISYEDTALPVGSSASFRVDSYVFDEQLLNRIFSDGL